MKKVLSIILSVSLCFLLSIQVSAAEVMPKENIIELEESNASISKTLPKLSSVNGTASRVASFLISSEQITSISLYANVASGDPFIVYIQAPDETIYSFVMAKSGKITLDNLTGCNPKGIWKIWIETQGIVSTVTFTVTISY